MGSVIVALCFTFGLFVYNQTIAKDKQMAKYNAGVKAFVFFITLIAFWGSLLLPTVILFGILWGTSALFPSAITSTSLLSYVHLAILTSFSLFLYEMLIESPIRGWAERSTIPFVSLLFAEILVETTLLLWLASLWVPNVQLTIYGTLFVSGFHVAVGYLTDRLFHKVPSKKQ